MAAHRLFSRGAARHGAGRGPTPSALEHTLLDQRRQAVGITGAPTRGRRPLYRALALSGGGIRSATFALGVLQAIARDGNPAAKNAPAAAGSEFLNSRLSTFDYLSTVSGGGYVGAFLCSLFMPNRLRSHDGLTRQERARRQAPAAAPQALARAWRMVTGLFTGDTAPARAAAPSPAASAPAAAAAATSAPPASPDKHAADDAVRVLKSGPPERIRSDDSYAGDAILRAPLAWLRENGRYLVPTGAGDAFYAAALGIRNWLALHYVIGTVLMMVVALVGLARAGIAKASVTAWCWELGALSSAADAAQDAATSGAFALGQIWWSPLFPLALLPIVLLGMPLGIGFWLVQERADGRSLPVNIAMACTLGVGLVLLAVGQALWPDLWSGLIAAWRNQQACEPASPLDRRLLMLVVAVAAVASALVYAVVALVNRSATMQRVLLTRRLAGVLALSAAIGGIALVDTVGQSLYLAASLGTSTGPVLTPAGLAALLTWLVKWLVGQAGQKEMPAWLKKVPVHALAGAAGVLIFVLLGGLWSLFVNWIVWGGQAPAPGDAFHGSEQVGVLGWVLLVTLLLAVVAGHFAAFINLSSLQAFYSSRLTRAYLGASNGERFENGRETLSAAEPLPGDQLTMDDYFSSHPSALKTLAPLHLINITVNKTVDPAEQLVQRDRKGQPMAVLPFGFSIDEQWSPGFPKASYVIGIKRPLPVGQWIGTSGAAFSTGIGRETSLGMSLLMGAANVRLGTWWQSDFREPGTGSMSTRNPALLLQHAIGAVFRTQTYLSYELRARFFGTHRRWQYLSDGGHFENTGLYELLRKDRRVCQIVCCDAGADPHYQFDDLANLIRLARIDLRVEIRVQTEFTGALANVFGAPADFRPFGAAPAAEGAPAATADCGPAAASSRSPCALLLWARHLDEDRPGTQIVVLKPHVTRDVPVDICQYAGRHPPFPQQTTADQFFDEAQWESYRALGFHLGSKIFDAAVMAELDTLARQQIGYDAVP